VATASRQQSMATTVQARCLIMAAPAGVSLT
jgi:hypothetical protein